MKVIPIPSLYDNYSYIILDHNDNEAIVVDPGESYPVLREAEKRGAYLRRVLCTHHHQDHVGGIPGLLEELPELEVYGYFTEKNRIKGLSNGLTDGDCLGFGKISVRTIFTPGHTTGSVCYLIGDCLFTGDTVFGGGVGRLFEGSAHQLYSSIYNKIKSLPDSTRLFFGHEYTYRNMKFACLVEPTNTLSATRLEEAAKQPNGGGIPSSLGLEKRTNPFFRCHIPEVVEYVKEHVVLVDDGCSEIFKGLRVLLDAHNSPKNL